MLTITNRTTIPFSEIELSDFRSQGAGGQNVNKVATRVEKTGVDLEEGG
jgi:ribosome-associated protein